MTVYKVEVHGFKITSQSKQVLLRVPEIGRYVSTYYMNRGSFGDAEKKFATAFTELQTPECPVAATWNADCDGSAHKYLETNADMLRGDLKEGKTGDQEYNYKWNFNGFIDETAGAPSAHPIPPKNGRLLKRGGEKRTGRMRLMMLAKQDRPLIVQVFADIGPGP